MTDAVFRMEEEEGVPGVALGHRRRRSTRRRRGCTAAADGQDGMPTNAAEATKKVEPIRNRGRTVGRNDPCPCGSGKKYKNCYMRQQVGPGAGSGEAARSSVRELDSRL